MMGGPPPPPAPPPPPPGPVPAPPPVTKERGKLLGDIHKGKKLKKTVTNDRSGPDLSAAKKGSQNGPGPGPMGMPMGGMKSPVPSPMSTPGNKASIGRNSGITPNRPMNPAPTSSYNPPPQAKPPPMMSNPPPNRMNPPTQNNRTTNPPPKPSPPPMGKANTSNPPPLRGPVGGPSRGPSVPKKNARALYDFFGQQDGDLSFRVNDTISILKQDGNWWQGECNGAVGVFPSNYVQML